MVGAGLLEPGGLVDRVAAHLVVDLHVGDLVRDDLEVRDRLAELPAVLGVADGLVQRGAHPADDPGQHHGALPVEALERHPPQRLALDGQDAGRRHPAALQVDLGRRRGAAAELVQLAADDEPRRAGVDDESGRPLVGLGQHRAHVGDRAVGDEDLGAVEHEVVAVADGGGADRGGVGPGLGLGARPRAHQAAVAQPGQPALLQLGAAVQPDRDAADHPVRAEAQAQAAVVAALGQRLVDQAAVHDRAAAATELLGDRQAGHAGLGQPLPDLGVPPAVAVAVGRSGGDDLLGQPPHRGEELLLLGSEAEVHLPRLTPANGVAASAGPGRACRRRTPRTR